MPWVGWIPRNFKISILKPLLWFLRQNHKYKHKHEFPDFHKFAPYDIGYMIYEFCLFTDDHSDVGYLREKFQNSCIRGNSSETHPWYHGCYLGFKMKIFKFFRIWPSHKRLNTSSNLSHLRVLRAFISIHFDSI